MSCKKIIYFYNQNVFLHDAKKNMCKTRPANYNVHKSKFNLTLPLRSGMVGAKATSASLISSNKSAGADSMVCQINSLCSDQEEMAFLNLSLEIGSEKMCFVCSFFLKQVYFKYQI